MIVILIFIIFLIKSLFPIIITAMIPSNSSHYIY